MKKFFLSTILVTVGVFLAQGALALTISPPKFELDGNPGSRILQTIKLFNETEEDRTFYPSLQDFTARGEEGEPGFLPPAQGEESEYGLSKWIKISQDPIPLDSKERKEIQFTVEIPESAEPGGHYAAILFSTQPPETISGATAIGIAGKIGSLVLLKVSGQTVESGKLLEFDTKDKKSFYTHLPVDFYVRFENLGNVHLKPQGDIKLHGLLDITSTPTTLLVNDAGGNALPKSIRRYDVSWTKSGLKTIGQGIFGELQSQWRGFAIGKFSAHLNLYYGAEGKQMSAEKNFWIFPWLLILAMVIGVTVLALGLRIGIRKYNAWIIKKAKG